MSLLLGLVGSIVVTNHADARRKGSSRAGSSKKRAAVSAARSSEQQRAASTAKQNAGSAAAAIAVAKAGVSAQAATPTTSAKDSCTTYVNACLNEICTGDTCKKITLNNLNNKFKFEGGSAMCVQAKAKECEPYALAAVTSFHEDFTLNAGAQYKNRLCPEGERIYAAAQSCNAVVGSHQYGIGRTEDLKNKLEAACGPSVLKGATFINVNEMVGRYIGSGSMGWDLSSRIDNITNLNLTNVDPTQARNDAGNITKSYYEMACMRCGTDCKPYKAVAYVKPELTIAQQAVSTAVNQWTSNSITNAMNKCSKFGHYDSAADCQRALPAGSDAYVCNANQVNGRLCYTIMDNPNRTVPAAPTCESLANGSYTTCPNAGVECYKANYGTLSCFVPCLGDYPKSVSVSTAPESAEFSASASSCYRIPAKPDPACTDLGAGWSNSCPGGGAIACYLESYSGLTCFKQCSAEYPKASQVSLVQSEEPGKVISPIDDHCYKDAPVIPDTPTCDASKEHYTQAVCNSRVTQAQRCERVSNSAAECYRVVEKCPGAGNYHISADANENKALQYRDVVGECYTVKSKNVVRNIPKPAYVGVMCYNTHTPDERDSKIRTVSLRLCQDGDDYKAASWAPNSYKTGTEYDLGTSAREPRAFISAEGKIFVYQIGYTVGNKLANLADFDILETSRDIIDRASCERILGEMDRVFTAKGGIDNFFGTRADGYKYMKYAPKDSEKQAGYDTPKDENAGLYYAQKNNYKFTYTSRLTSEQVNKLKSTLSNYKQMCARLPN